MNEITNNKREVISPNIIVVPMLRNVEETIVGIIINIEKGFKIPPVKYKRKVSCKISIIKKLRWKYGFYRT